jgi:hypothetical protein
MLFLLYKFTSFFTYIYNFGKFLGKLTQGILYIKNRTSLFLKNRRNEYVNVETNQTTHNKSILTRIKNKFVNYIWGNKNKTEVLPLYETRVSNISFKKSSCSGQEDRIYFENHINNLMMESTASCNQEPEVENSEYKYYLDTSYQSQESKNTKEYKEEIENQVENENSNLLLESNFIKEKLNGY